MLHDNPAPVLKGEEIHFLKSISLLFETEKKVKLQLKMFQPLL